MPRNELRIVPNGPDEPAENVNDVSQRAFFIALGSEGRPHKLRQQVFDDAAVDIRQAKVAALMTVR